MMTRKQKKAYNLKLRLAAEARKKQEKKAGTNQRIPNNLSGPERQVYIDRILQTAETKTDLQKAKTWKQVEALNKDKEVTYITSIDKHGTAKTQTKIKRQTPLRNTDYRTLKKRIDI